MNLEHIARKLSSKTEFDYSLVYGDVTDLMLTMDVELINNIGGELDLKMFLNAYAKYLSGDDIVISGRNTENGFTLMIGKAVELGSNVMSPVQFLRYRMSDDTVDSTGNTVQLMKEYAEYYHSEKSI
jgi:hypothetical protein